MKICIISNRNIYIKKISNYLTSKNFDVYIICRNKNGISENEFNKNIKFIYLNSSSLLKKFFEIRRIIRFINPDIVHLHYATKDSIIPALIFNRKYKYIISIWGSDINLFSKNILNKIFQNVSFLIADKIHVLSLYMFDDLKKRFFFINNNKIEIFSWGINTEIFDSVSEREIKEVKKNFGISNSEIIILSYRNHKELYNHHTIIKAIPLVLKNNKKVKFVFTTGSYNENYLIKSKKLINKLQVDSNIVFINRWLKDNELIALIKSAHISINIPLFDGLPATLFEIMYSGSIPIATYLPNYKPFYKDEINGFYLFNSHSEVELADIITKIIKNYEIYHKKIANTNKKYIETEQNFKNNIKNLILLYK